MHGTCDILLMSTYVNHDITRTYFGLNGIQLSSSLLVSTIKLLVLHIPASSNVICVSQHVPIHPISGIYRLRRKQLRVYISDIDNISAICVVNVAIVVDKS
jgi:hypothetical protein